MSADGWIGIANEDGMTNWQWDKDKEIDTEAEAKAKYEENNNWWARLSTKYVQGIPKGSTVNAFINNPSATGIYNAVEKPLLSKSSSIIEHVVKP